MINSCERKFLVLDFLMLKNLHCEKCMNLENGPLLFYTGEPDRIIFFIKLHLDLRDSILVQDG